MKDQLYCGQRPPRRSARGRQFPRVVKLVVWPAAHTCERLQDELAIIGDLSLVFESNLSRRQWHGYVHG